MPCEICERWIEDEWLQWRSPGGDGLFWVFVCVSCKERNLQSLPAAQPDPAEAQGALNPAAQPDPVESQGALDPPRLLPAASPGYLETLRPILHFFRLVFPNGRQVAEVHHAVDSVQQFVQHMNEGVIPRISGAVRD